MKENRDPNASSFGGVCHSFVITPKKEHVAGLRRFWSGIQIRDIEPTYKDSWRMKA